MFSVKRNQVIITALVVMIAVAGYLNYVDGTSPERNQNQIALNDNGEISALVPSLTEDEMSATQTSFFDSTGGEIGEALTTEDNPAIVMGEGTIEAELVEAEDPTSDPGEAVFVNTSVDSSYFVQAKLDREQVRSKQKDLLMGMISDTQLSQDQRGVCADAMLEIQKRIEKESAAEAMIEAKGFKEVYVRIDDTTVDVVVNKEALTDAEIAQIEDIVKRKTGMQADQIRISPMKK